MAQRICFISTPQETLPYRELVVDFKYSNGFAITQKHKSIQAFHSAIRQVDPAYSVLEISTKSTDAVGVALSAFNLLFYDEETSCEYALENIFQSSKVFEHGGPFRNLLHVRPKDAKRDNRLTECGRLTHFEYSGRRWELEPKTMFYDWIYIRALARNPLLSERIMDFDVFTDIEFNHKRSINCQARAAAIFVTLKKRGILEKTIADKADFSGIYTEVRQEYVQASFFD